MDNQHRQIKGYRELTEADIKLMNTVKEMGQGFGDVIAILEKDPSIDQRWLAIAKTDLQKGVMALVRSIAQPTTF